MNKTIIWYFKNGLKNIAIDQTLNHEESKNLIEKNYNAIYIASHILDPSIEKEYFPVEEK